jgi:thiamine pyrophosphate-dependent acetolactate synthase large subunit-like protein
VAQVSWLPAIYYAMNASANLTLVKARVQFGIPAMTHGLLIAYAMEACDTLLMLGTDFPYRLFYPTKARIAQVDIRGENLGRRCRLHLGVIGDVREVLSRLTDRLSQQDDHTHLNTAVRHYAKAREELDDLPGGLEDRFLSNILAIKDRARHPRAVAMQPWSQVPLLRRLEFRSQSHQGKGLGEIGL